MHYNKYIKIYTNILGGSLMNLFESDFHIIAPIVAAHAPFGALKAKERNRPSHGLAFFAAGEHTYRFPYYGAISCKSGDCIFLPKGCKYKVRRKPADRTDSRYMYIINFEISNDEPLEPFKLSAADPERMLALFEEADRDWTRKSLGYSEAVTGDLYKIISLLRRDYQSSRYGTRYHELVAPALKYIEEHYTLPEKLDAETLAAKCGISAQYLRKLFARCYGVSLKDYVINLRLDHAVELMIKGGFGVETASDMCGFNNAKYFSRFFKERYGMTPKEFSQKHIK